MPMTIADFGLIDLAVMGQNLVLIMNDHGFKVAVFNRTVSRVDDYFKTEVDSAQAVWSKVIATAVEAGVPVPAMSSVLAFNDG
jgi:6-phosphogluconate dehydrogenase